MIDVGSYFHALKASLVKRLCYTRKNSTWGFIPTCNLRKLHVLVVIDLLSETDINKYQWFNHIPPLLQTSYREDKFMEISNMKLNKMIFI